MDNKITFGLSVNEINKAIKGLNKLKMKLRKEFCENVVKRLAQEGVGIMVEKITECGIQSQTGTLLSSIDWVPVTYNKYKIVVNCDYAIYVEFGTGIVGAQNSHPRASAEGITYDRNGHGEDGWVYEKDGKFYHTKGQPAKPFVYETYEELQRRVNKIIEEEYEKVFK